MVLTFVIKRDTHPDARMVAASSNWFQFGEKYDKKNSKDAVGSRKILNISLYLSWDINKAIRVIPRYHPTTFASEYLSKLYFICCIVLRSRLTQRNFNWRRLFAFIMFKLNKAEDTIYLCTIITVLYFSSLLWAVLQHSNVYAHNIS